MPWMQRYDFSETENVAVHFKDLIILAPDEISREKGLLLTENQCFISFKISGLNHRLWSGGLISNLLLLQGRTAQGTSQSQQGEKNDTVIIIN